MQLCVVMTMEEISEEELEDLLLQYGDDARIVNLISAYQKQLKTFDNCPEGYPYCLGD